MFKRSFTNEIDDTFESAMLTPDTKDYLKVLTIEIWGLPEHNSFKVLQDYRNNQQKRRKNDAMRNKKALFDNDFNKVEMRRK